MLISLRKAQQLFYTKINMWKPRYNGKIDCRVHLRLGTLNRKSLLLRFCTLINFSNLLLFNET